MEKEKENNHNYELEQRKRSPNRVKRNSEEDVIVEIKG